MIAALLLSLQQKIEMDYEYRKIEVQRLVNTMTNRMRNKWAKAGYPGLRRKEPDKVAPYADLRCDPSRGPAAGASQ